MKTWLIILVSFLIFHIMFSLLFAETDKGTGIIRGRVLLDTDAPDLPQIVVDKSVDFCGEKVTDPLLNSPRSKSSRSSCFHRLEWRDADNGATRTCFTFKADGVFFNLVFRWHKSAHFLHSTAVMRSSTTLTAGGMIQKQCLILRS